MYEFKRHQLVDFVGVVPIPLQMTSYHGLNPPSLNIGSGKTAAVEQQFPHVCCESIAVPDTELQILMPSQKNAFEAKGRKEMIHASDRLGHSHVIRVLRFKQEFEQEPRNRPGEAAAISRQASVGGNLQKRLVSISNQPETHGIIRDGRFGCAEYGPDQIVV